MKKTYLNKKNLLIIILLITSILFNQYYGNIGVQPIDSFFSFNSAYDVLNGYFPFKDYWTITGPFIDLVQAIFFKLFGVSWFSYVLHASIFNFIFTIFFFYTLRKFELNINYCFLYSLFLSFLAYPSAGTPYVDHQSSYLSAMAVFSFILALKNESRIWWFILPVILGLSFLTKQTPSGHILLIISLLSTVYFIFNFDIKKIIFGLAGTLTITLIFFLFLFLGDIPLNSFVQQYILFPLTLGESRLDFLFPLEFNRIILRFKIIHISALILIFVAIKNIINDYKYLFSNEFLSILSLIGLIFSLIAHQLMTINGIYIYFLIPILIGFSHIYFEKYYKRKNLVINLLITLSFCSTIYYGYKYVNKRNFMDLQNSNISKSVNAGVISDKLSGLKWITPQYSNDPEQEISKLQEAIKIIQNDKSNIMLVTDYQFISVVNSFYDFSPNKVWYYFHVYPAKDNKYFEVYRNFFIKKIKKNNIKSIYIIKPMYGDDNILRDIIPSKCSRKEILTDILEQEILLNCENLR